MIGDLISNVILLPALRSQVTMLRGADDRFVDVSAEVTRMEVSEMIFDKYRFNHFSIRMLIDSYL